MQLPDRHHYDLYLRSMGGEAIVFSGRSQLYAALLAAVSALLLALYALGVWRMPFHDLGAAAHIIVLGGALFLGLGALWLTTRRERLVLKREGGTAVYQLALGRQRYRWESPLGAFSAVTAELVAKSDGKAVGQRYWAFHLDRWDGARVTFNPSRFALLPAKEAERATRLARSLGAFLQCEVRIEDETRISMIGEEVERSLPPTAQPAA